VVRLNLEVRPYLPSTKFLCRILIGGDTSVWIKFGRAGRTYGRTYDFSQIHQDNHYKLPSALLITIQPSAQKLAWVGDTPFSIKEGKSNQTNFQHLVYHIWIKEKQQKYLLQPCAWNLVYIPSVWKWWMGAMLKLCKNLVYIFVLYAFLNMLVYLEARAWNKTLWEANAYDQT
jgi:hypothetical protein